LKVTAIIAAAGLGKRFGSQTPKQFHQLGGRPLLAWSIDTFTKVPFIEDIVVVAPPSDESSTLKIVKSFSNEKPITVIAGGATRQESVRQGLLSIDEKKTWIAVHDAARPLVPQSDIEAVCLMAQEIGAAILAIPVHDTVKLVDEDGLIVRTLDRDRIYLAQTPQVCRRKDLVSAYELAERKNIKVTDEASLLEAAGMAVGVVPGKPRNIKITTEDDFILAEALIKTL